MEILFKTPRLARLFNSDQLLRRRLGDRRAQIVRRRLDQLRAAAHLAELRNLPGRCHELTGNLAGNLTLDLDGPNRLLFEPAENPMPTKTDGGLDWKRVRSVRILGIEDTHE